MLFRIKPLDWDDAAPYESYFQRSVTGGYWYIIRDYKSGEAYLLRIAASNGDLTDEYDGVSTIHKTIDDAWAAANAHHAEWLMRYLEKVE